MGAVAAGVVLESTAGCREAGGADADIAAAEEDPVRSTIKEAGGAEAAGGAMGGGSAAVAVVEEEAGADCSVHKSSISLECNARGA